MKLGWSKTKHNIWVWSTSTQTHSSLGKIPRYLRIRGQGICAAAIVRLQAAGSSPFGGTLEVLAEVVASILGAGRRLATFRLLRGRHRVRILAIAVRVHGQVPEQILQQNVRLGIALTFRRRFQFRAVSMDQRFFKLFTNTQQKPRIASKQYSNIWNYWNNWQHRPTHKYNRYGGRGQVEFTILKRCT